MTPTWVSECGTAALYNADCLDVLPRLSGVDAVVCDPPYGLEFMGKDWDAPWQPGCGGMSSVGFREKLYKDGSKAMLPVGTGGTNPTCRNCGGLRNGTDQKKGQPPCRCDAPRFDNVHAPRGRAFQDWCCQWATALLSAVKPGGYMLCFGGTRTHHRLMCGLEDAGWEIRDVIMWVYGSGFPKGKGCLKPAWEPIIVVRKPGSKVLPLQIDECRIEGTPETTRFDPAKHLHEGWRFNNSGADTAVRAEQNNGRWPANLIHDGSEEVLELFPQSKGQSGDVRGTEPSRTGDENTNCYGEFDRVAAPKRGDSGNAARFFYCAKADREDRGEGNTHPTVKPHDLMRYLCRLVTPPGGVVLDPFLGSGSTGKAAAAEGFRFVGVEKDTENGYFATAAARIGKALAERDSPLFPGWRADPKPAAASTLFDSVE